MVAYFKWINNLAMAIGAILGGALIAILYKGQILGSDFTKGVYFALGVIVGVIIGRTVSSIYANKRLQKIYALLYTECDPKQFIKEFAPLNERVPKDIAEYMVGRAHLAFAWEALGDFDKALEMVGNIDPTELKLHMLNTSSLITNRRVTLYTLMGDYEKAKEQVEALKALEEVAKKRSTTLAKNLEQCIRLNNARIAAATEENTDVAYLEEEIALAGNAIYKKEIQLALAQFFERTGQGQKAAALFVDILKDKRGLYTERVAQGKK